MKVHIRLSEKAKEYRDLKEQRKYQYTMFDDSGRKLFSPEINRGRNAPGSLNQSFHSHGSSVTAPAPQVNTVSADEFLYQDAKDREIRHQNLILQYREEAQQAANLKKVNTTSYKLLKRKTVCLIAVNNSLAMTSLNYFLFRIRFLGARGINLVFSH